MSHIRSRNTRPEMLVRLWLWHYGYRYRLNVKSIIGTPDIVLRKYNTVIFINGCFWHGHNCDKFNLPKSNTDFWQKKIERNRNRDNENFKQLSAAGWHVIVLWECQLSKHHFFQTMQALDLRLSRYLLDIHNQTAKPHCYPDISQQDTAIAAEPTIRYTAAKNHSKNDNQ